MSTNIINPIEKRRYDGIKFSTKVISLVFIVVAINGSKNELVCIHIVE